MNKKTSHETAEYSCNQRYKLLRYPEASRYLSIAETTLRRWASEKRIPHIKIGGRVLFDIQELNRFIESARIGIQ